MKHAATRDLFAYWDALRGERTAPERSEINPAEIRDVLADTFMLEVDLGKRFPFRLAGTRVSGLFDHEQKGQSFLDLWREEERRNVAAILLTVADGACPVVAGGVSQADGRDECPVELLFLPLRHYGRTHARILGLIKPMKKPAWAGLLPLGPMSLRSLRVIESAEPRQQQPLERIAVGQSPQAPRADEQALPGSAHPSSKPYLRLIRGGLS